MIQSGFISECWRELEASQGGVVKLIQWIFELLVEVPQHPLYRIRVKFRRDMNAAQMTEIHPQPSQCPKIEETWPRMSFNYHARSRPSMPPLFPSY